jgi:hypothetical protein
MLSRRISADREGSWIQTPGWLVPVCVHRGWAQVRVGGGVGFPEGRRGSAACIGVLPPASRRYRRQRFRPHLRPLWSGCALGELGSARACPHRDRRKDLSARAAARRRSRDVRGALRGRELSDNSVAKGGSLRSAAAFLTANSIVR